MINKYFFRIMGVLLLAVLAVGYCKADGTRNTTNAGRALKDQACSISHRLVDSAGKPTNYYALAGESEWFYSNCAVTGKYVKLK